MADTLEHLQELDRQMQLIESLLTQAVQATQQAAEVITTRIPNGTAPNLVEALPHLQQALHVAVDGHNRLSAEIQVAQREAQTQAQEGSYNPDGI